MFAIRAFLRVLGLVLILSWATPLQAQLNRGVMEGTVTDPQGAVVPGVEVTITAVDTNVSISTKTNAVGYYRAVDLVSGKYVAHFVAGAFSPLEVLGIEVRAGQVIKVDAQLKLEANRQLIEVTAEVPLIETAASNFSTTLPTSIIQEVPLQGRDLQQLVFLIPGVNNVGGPPGGNFGFNSQYGTFPDPTNSLGSDISVNGGQGGANAWYLDGNLNHSSLAEAVVVNPSPDAVHEFQAITNGFAAEYGRTGGAVFSVALKSGTNGLHGNVYEFLRNDATNARNPFTSIDDLGNLIKDRQLRYNNFGGTLGGPVVIPHLYNGKNKTFFSSPLTPKSCTCWVIKFLPFPRRECGKATSARILTCFLTAYGIPTARWVQILTQDYLSAGPLARQFPATRLGRMAAPLRQLRRTRETATSPPKFPPTGSTRQPCSS